jgi:NADH:ubiquinone oxidoreductase subunit 2 (subunit N)
VDVKDLGATLFYTTIYAFTLIGAFGVVALVRRETGGDDLQDFAGYMRARLARRLHGGIHVVVGGLPPLAGFFGKFYLFSAHFGAGANHGLLWLVVLALFGSLISLYYYLIVLKVIFQTQGAERAWQSSPGRKWTCQTNHRLRCSRGPVSRNRTAIPCHANPCRIALSASSAR